eukprot:CAMPEP_0116012994 /NCGR_PEP_ID=MMETSP0321-20121206/5456_1 /TAXON_ID=163516 /ORGANISM="Leptocylindrus danicus var. danicus, Strain B650" /LENGTH=39 /DNA_ID= /DNA_START= /DNA_END= /DNA_ORIENTATION=
MSPQAASYQQDPTEDKIKASEMVKAGHFCGKLHCITGYY